MALDDWIAKISPGWAVARARARHELAIRARYYDAATPTKFHPPPRGGNLSGDAIMGRTTDKLRSFARDLDENHDLAVGVLNTLVDNVVGDGMTVEPMVRTPTGDPALDFNDTVRALWREWWARPEVTREYAGHQVERLVALSWFRDGEVLSRDWTGLRFDNGSGVPYALQLLEADFLPYLLFDAAPDVTHGVEKDALGRPTAYHLYLEHPGNFGTGVAGFSFGTLNPAIETERVRADRVIHLKLTRRIGQTRGVPILTAVLQRLSDIKEGEESERIAMRVAADFCAVITRNADLAFDTGPTGHDSQGATERTFAMESGKIFDKLLPGESVETIDSKRPNNAIIDFRNAMLRAVASGTGTSYSSIAKDYDGSYSAQRQELVESVPAYGRLSQSFADGFMRPVYRRFIDRAELAGALVVPRGVDRETLYDAMISRGGGIPWIDPLKEVQADREAVGAGFLSRQAVIRKRGGRPQEVDAELEADTFRPTAPSSSSEPDEAEEGGEDEQGDERATG